MTRVFVVAVGVDVLRHVGGRRDHLLLASIPLPLSGFTHIVRWGIGNLVAVVVLAVLTLAARINRRASRSTCDEPVSGQR